MGIVLAGIYVIDEIKICMKNKELQLQKRILLSVVSAFASVAIPLLMWKIHLNSRNVSSLWNGKIDIGQLVNIYLWKDDTYRQSVWKDYLKALWLKQVSIGSTGILISYGVVMLLTIAGCIFMWTKCKERSAIYKEQSFKNVLYGYLIYFFIYFVGLGITYLFVLTEGESKELICFDRYISIAILPLWVLFICLILVYLQRIYDTVKYYCLLVVSLLVLVSPTDTIVSYLDRETYDYSVGIRRVNFLPIINLINDIAGEGEKIYFISQEAKGTFDYFYCKYYVRPRIFPAEGNYFTWSIGEPFYDGDVITRTITVDEWQAELLEEYDYVAIYRLNDYFIEHFSSIFENPGDIAENTLFRVNTETGFLELCGAYNSND